MVCHWFRYVIRMKSVKLLSANPNPEQWHTLCMVYLQVPVLGCCSCCYILCFVEVIYSYFPK